MDIRKDLLGFTEADGFRDDWKDLGLSIDQLVELQNVILKAPKGGDTIQGTGGVRKLRFSPEAWKKGKSGAIRVLYVHFDDLGLVGLLVAYAKNEQDNIPAAEKKALRQYVERFRKAWKGKRL